MILVRKVENHLEDLGVDGRVILRRILNTMGWRGLDSCGLVQRQDTHEHINERSGSINCGSTE